MVLPEEIPNNFTERLEKSYVSGEVSGNKEKEKAQKLGQGKEGLV